MKNWIDRYLYAVGQKLPKAQREDITKELRSLILDALDEKTASDRLAKGEAYEEEEKEEDVLSILESFGPPAEVAAKYKSSGRYLIGPELYDLYRLLLTIVLGAVALGICIATLVSILSTQGHFIELLYKLPMQMISAAISAVGSVTIVFAIIQYFAKEEDIKDMNPNSKWSPKDLEPVPVSYEVIKASEVYAAICFTILGIIIFNRFPHIIAIYYNQGAQTISVPIFSIDTLRLYMPYLNIFWIGNVLLNAYKLRIGKWTNALRFIQIGVDIGSLAIFLMMAGNPGILNPAVKESIMNTDFAPLQRLGDIGTTSFKIFIAIIVLTTVFEVCKHIYYSIKK